MDFSLRLFDDFAFEGSALRIKGRGLDRIAIIGKEMIADKSFLAGQPAFTAILRNWETIAHRLASTWKDKRTLTCAFLDTIAQGTSSSLEWYLRHGTGVLKEVTPRHFANLRTSALWPGG